MAAAGEMRQQHKADWQGRWQVRRLARRYGLSILAAALAVSVVVSLPMFIAAPLYEAEAVMIIEPGPGEAAAAGLTDSLKASRTQQEIIRSRSVLAPVVLSLKLDQKPEYADRAASYSGGSRNDYLIDEFRRHLTITPLADSNLVAVRFAARDPELAMQGTNLVTENYIAFNDQLQIDDTARAAELMLHKIEQFTIPRGRLRDIDTGVNAEGRAGTTPVQLPDLSSDPELLRLIEESIISSIVAAYPAGLLQPAHARVIDAAVLPQEALSTFRPGISVAGFVLSLLTGIITVLLWFRFKPSVSNASELESRLAASPLGALPRLDPLDPASRADYAESLRSLRTAIGIKPEGHPARVILVTSSAAGEGKSTVALNLAEVMGKVERVLLIDANLRTASQETLCGLPAGSAGLSHLIAGAAQMRDCIHHLDGKGIDVMPAGVLPPNPQELLSCKRFQKVLDVLEGRYECLIIDSLPARSVSDPLLLAPRCSTVLYVLQADRTSMADAREGLERLHKAGAPSAGIILNQVRSQKAPRFRFGRGKAADLSEEGYGYSCDTPGGGYLVNSSR